MVEEIRLVSSPEQHLRKQQSAKYISSRGQFHVTSDTGGSLVNIMHESLVASGLSMLWYWSLRRPMTVINMAKGSPEVIANTALF